MGNLFLGWFVEMPTIQDCTTMASLYPSLLGAAWMELHESVRRMHAEGKAVHATGTFRVQRGCNWLARVIGRLARLPTAGEGIPVVLAILPQGQEEEWRRSFAGRPFVTRQWGRADGLLAEQIGRLELRFRLEVAEGSLHYRPRGAGLRIGSLHLPLPCLLVPRVEAWESPGEKEGQVQVRVEVCLPLAGLLVTYEGTMERKSG